MHGAVCDGNNGRALEPKTADRVHVNCLGISDKCDNNGRIDWKMHTCGHGDKETKLICVLCSHEITS